MESASLRTLNTITLAPPSCAPQHCSFLKVSPLMSLLIAFVTAVTSTDWEVSRLQAPSLSPRRTYDPSLWTPYDTSLTDIIFQKRDHGICVVANVEYDNPCLSLKHASTLQLPQGITLDVLTDRLQHCCAAYGLMDSASSSTSLSLTPLSPLINSEMDLRGAQPVSMSKSTAVVTTAEKMD
jgi:hypothetical protein